ncbi:MAG: hypothetical protein ABXS92_03195 [Sulfurimonas sp.]
MKELNAKLIFILVDISVIFLSIVLAYFLRYLLADFFGGEDSYALSNYTGFSLSISSLFPFLPMRASIPTVMIFGMRAGSLSRGWLSAS